MMIPLVIRLAEKDKLLDEELRAKLMDIRQMSREISFKKNPNQRGYQSSLPDSFTKYFIQRSITTAAKAPKSVFLRQVVVTE